MVISFKTIQNRQNLSHPAPLKACRFVQAARAQSRIDHPPTDEVKAAFENSATRAFGPAGFLEQDDSENWCEIQKLLKGHRARNSKLCLEMGLGQEKRRDDGIPGITNYIFSETAARGMYQRWADLLSSESWQEVLDKTAAYQQEVMK